MSDLDGMTLEELRDLKERVKQAIRDYEGRRRSEAIKELHRVAQSHGYTLQALTGTRMRGKNKGAE